MTNQMVVEVEVCVSTVQRQRLIAVVFQGLADSQELIPSLGGVDNATGIESVLVVEDTANLGLLYDGVQVASPFFGLIVKASVAEVIITDSVCHLGQVVGVGSVSVADTVVIILEDVQFFARFQRGRNQGVDIAAFPLDVDVCASFSLESVSGGLNCICLNLTGRPHRPHGQLNALILLAISSRRLGSRGFSRSSRGSFRTLSAATTSSQRCCHSRSHQKCNDLLHLCFPPKCNFYVGISSLSR